MAESFKTKYRSTTFDEYVGNELLKTTVLNRFATEQPYPIVTMVYGESGCGKTTIARLIAKQVMCENKITKSINDKLYHIPCNKCNTCEELDYYISSGDDTRLHSVNELDSTRARSSSAIDDFINEASIPNMYGTYNIHILDEAHMLSVGAQNNLLKFFEDAPDKTMFLICTTDPHKIINTIHTRVDLFLEVQKPTLEDNIQLLEMVANRENIAFERTALALIAERSKLVYRSSLSMLENVYRGYQRVDYASVVKVLGDVPTDVYFAFFKHLLNNNLVLYTQLINKVQRDTGLSKFVDELSEFVKRGLYISMGLSVEGVTKDELSKYKALFKQFSLEEVFSLLKFLDTVKSGDIETRLLILGYQGIVPLSPKETPVEEVNSLTGIMLSEDDVAQERRVISEVREEAREAIREKTLTDAKSELQSVSLETLMKSLFNN